MLVLFAFRMNLKALSLTIPSKKSIYAPLSFKLIRNSEAALECDMLSTPIFSVIVYQFVLMKKNKFLRWINGQIQITTSVIAAFHEYQAFW